jgi:hypothetical protein
MRWGIVSIGMNQGKLAEKQGRKAKGSNVRKNDDSLAAE